MPHRLRSSAFKRPDDGLNEMPRSIVFLVLEGSVTEPQYFTYVEKYKHNLGIHPLVRVEPLTRWKRDTATDVDSMLAILQECDNIRNKGVQIENICEMTEGKYTKKDIQRYVAQEMTPIEERKLEENLFQQQIDIAYYRYLTNVKGKDTDDTFGIVLDRDQNNRSLSHMEHLLARCEQEGWECFLTNPCFEFWLLLHVCDVQAEYINKLDCLLKNPKISQHHTYVSAELSKRVGHRKGLSETQFEMNYLPNIDRAIERAEQLTKSNEELVNGIGSSMPELFRILREKS